MGLYSTDAVVVPFSYNITMSLPIFSSATLIWLSLLHPLKLLISMLPNLLSKSLFLPLLTCQQQSTRLSPPLQTFFICLLEYS